jgi:hypothetical protein
MTHSIDPAAATALARSLFTVASAQYEIEPLDPAT